MYDSLKTVDISFLAKQGYLKPNQWQSGTITWSRNGNKIGCISVCVNTQAESPYLELNYECDKVPINYQLQLVPVLSNLGKGFVWYFRCPLTFKKCRKLYFGGKYFGHRTLIPEAMYQSQTQSQSDRSFEKAYGHIFQRERIFEQIYDRRFPNYYKNKPTKRYLELCKKLQAYDNSAKIVKGYLDSLEKRCQH